MDKEELNEKLLNACCNGNLDVVKYLLTSPYLKEHADINYTNIYDINALMFACCDGHLEIVKYLLSSPDLKEHINIHHKNKDGWNSIIYAIYHENNLELVKFLLTSPDLKVHANIHDKDNYGMNALIFACLSNRINIAEYLILEQNMQIDEDTMNLLIKFKFFDVIKIIETRDLKNKLNNKLEVKQVIKRNKI